MSTSSKKKFMWLPFLLVGAVLFFTTACSDDDDDKLPQEDFIGEWQSLPGFGEVEVLRLNEDLSSWFGFIYEGQMDWVSQNDTWKTSKSGVIVEDEEGTLEYLAVSEDGETVLVCPLDGTLYFKTNGGNNGDENGNGDEYTKESMAGTFTNVAERINVVLSSDGSAILEKVEGQHASQSGEIDENATWTIENYEAPSGVSSEDNPLSIVIEHSNSEFDDPYVLIIESENELKCHWQQTLTRDDE
ncbi:hypothetical protein QA597_04505 [Marinilabiliaceae bacterium ANBcel2]|nr:hypothetical protein [Marinilabiliaceae bacterium ANBcel2]